ncbi:type 2 lanthipeptide synthetase LanM [Pseudochrobactrum sp. MP213Fo]|uniref:type 2 lanthipeptide synthetase LanM n=1 Tax=Pseudochrobactrum sp. MP213Fo TaxID=3022250 RepID=UPI003B9F31E9
MFMFQNEIFGNVYLHITHKLIEHLSRLPSHFISKNTCQKLIETAYLPLLRRAWERLLMVEMNFADAEGLLHGDTVAERFEYFATEIVKPDNFSFLADKYPDLWPRWRQQAEPLAQSLATLIHRIDADILSVAAAFYEDESVTAVTDITFVGDPHRGMQQTARITFVNEKRNIRTIYYKPRNLAIDAGFIAFVEWWNEHAPIKHLVPNVLLREGYGWAQGVEQKACADENEVQYYYRCYGSLVALTHIFGATDLHKENIVAAGQYSVIVDSETLFSCLLEDEKNSPRISHLYASLLLPAHQQGGAIDISPLTSQTADKIDIEVMVNPQRRESNTRLEPRKLVMEQCNCEVRLGETPISDFSSYDVCLINGMNQTFAFILDNRDTVFEKLKHSMQGVTTRIIFRATSNYSTLLNNSWHPDAMIRREANCELLKLANPSLSPDILKAEFEQLQNGDIPYFEMAFGDSTVTDASGNTLCVPVLLTPIQLVQRQLARLSPRFIESANDDLRYTLYTYRLRPGRKTALSGWSCEHQSDLSNSQWLDFMAETILNQVLEQALEIEGSYCWRTISPVTATKLQAGLSLFDLYDGAAGIALAFHLAGLRLKDERYLKFADLLAEQVTGQLDAEPTAEMGALNGAAGSLWAVSLIQSDRLTHKLPVMQRTLSKLCYRLLSHKWEHYNELDYVSGASGSLEMLLRLHDIYRDYPIATEIQQLADVLFHRIITHGLSLRQEDTLLGFAHGTAGVSAAIAQYMQRFNIENAQAVWLIESNLKRETALRTEKGWPRLDTGAPADASWCHGTAGFGFSRLLLRPYMAPEIFNADMRVVKARLGEPQGSLGICHGSMADYYLERALGESGDHALGKVRLELERAGLITNYGLNGSELVGAMTGTASLFAGAAILLNTIVF